MLKARLLRARPARILGRWWESISFATPNPGRRLALLAVSGAVMGVAEAAVVVLVVALASRGETGTGVGNIEGLPDSTIALAALALGALAMLASAQTLSAWMAARSASDVTRRVQHMLVAAYLDAPATAQNQTKTGELQDLVTMRTMVVATATQDGATAISAALNLCVLLVAALFVSAWATLCLLAAAGFVTALGLPFRGRRREIISRVRHSSAAVATEVAETSSMARDLRVFAATGAAMDRLAARFDDYARHFLALRIAQSLRPQLTRDATVAVVVIVLAIVVGAADSSLASIGATVVLMLRALTHSQSMQSTALRMLEREDHLADIRRRLEAWRARPRGTRPCPSVTSIAMRGIRFSYPDAERAALDGVDLELRAGEQLGVVGRSGAGKSTLVSVLLGLFPPDDGRVSVGEVDLEEIDPLAWHARTAWVGQEPRLLSGTVRENVRFLRAHLDDEALLRAAIAAGLGPELDRWPDGLDHEVGVAGAALSVGQRQRVAMARALAGEPAVLVLDEPTSALDAHSEAALYTALQQLRHDRIVVIVAHRPAMVRACDRIAVLEHGRLTALAPPAQLALDSAYFNEVLALSGR